MTIRIASGTIRIASGYLIMQCSMIAPSTSILYTISSKIEFIRAKLCIILIKASFFRMLFPSSLSPINEAEDLLHYSYWFDHCDLSL